MDDEDQKWVDKLRHSHQPKSANSVKPMAKSDAVLNCPACMTTLCLDCQRYCILSLSLPVSLSIRKTNSYNLYGF